MRQVVPEIAPPTISSTILNPGTRNYMSLRYPKSLALLLPVAMLAAACSDDPVAPAVPAFLGSTISAVPENNLAALVAVKAGGYDSVRVRYWISGEEARETPAFSFPPDSIARVPVLGLVATSAYQVETVLYLENESIAADTAAFSSGPVPEWIPAIDAIGSDTTAGYLAISLPDGGVIVDNTGRVVWYAYLPAGVLNSFQVHANGTYTLRDTPGTIHVLNVLGQRIGTLECVGYTARFHDIMILRDGSAWIMCDDHRTMDLSSLGGSAAADVSATVIQHLSATGQVLFQWNAFDHFDITDLPAADRSGPAVNFTHGNALELDTDGNLLASFRSLSEVTKINATTGAVMWRLGGLANEFTFINDPKGGFERQHGVRLAGPGQIQLLDNGVEAPSRLARYLINPVQKTALLVMSFVDAPTTFTSVGGSTDYYPSGHAVVSFGRAGRVVEVDAAGNRAWELGGLDGTYVFRAERLGDLYAPVTLSRASR